tara:strand:+ start:504 stop:758 length:255 start_codon:yes stop_codon:yes gene_type:complete
MATKLKPRWEARRLYTGERMKPLIQKLIEERHRQKKSQRDLDLDMGFANSLVSRWECGDRSPSAFALFVWAEALGMDIKLEHKP